MSFDLTLGSAVSKGARYVLKNVFLADVRAYEYLLISEDGRVVDRIIATPEDWMYSEYRPNFTAISPMDYWRIVNVTQ